MNFDSKNLTSVVEQKNLGWGSILDEWWPLWGGTNPKAWRMHPQAQGGLDGMEGMDGDGRKFPPWKPQKIEQLVKWGHAWMEGKWNDSYWTNQSIFRGKVLVSGRGAWFFCCWFDVWRMDGRDINCMYFFVVKLTELQHLNQHVHLFAKKSTGLRIFALGSQASSVFSKFLWTQLGHLGCWFELPGQDSINIMWLACTFLVEGYDYFFFWGGSYWHQWWMCTKHAYWLPRRQKNWTRNQGTYQMFSGSFDGTTSTGSCFLPNKNRLLQWEKFEFMISRDQKHHEGWVDTQISIISPLSSPRRGFFWITKGESFIKAKLPLNPWNTQVTLGKQLGLPLWPSQSECC